LDQSACLSASIVVQVTLQLVLEASARSALLEPTHLALQTLLALAVQQEHMVTPSQQLKDLHPSLIAFLALLDTFQES